MKRQFLALSAAMIAGTVVFTSIGRSDDPATAKAIEQSPEYTQDGQLKLPRDFRQWIFVGTALGLSYGDDAPYPDEQKYTSVYITPAAYEQYARTGEFPEKTMLAMAVYRQEKKQPSGDLKLQGSFEGEFLSVELAVKDSARGGDEWSYYDFSRDAGKQDLRQTAKAFPTEKCYNCHLEHASDDNVFVQYYPVLRRLKKNAP